MQEEHILCKFTVASVCVCKNYGIMQSYLLKIKHCKCKKKEKNYLFHNNSLNKYHFMNNTIANICLPQCVFLDVHMSANLMENWFLLKEKYLELSKEFP